MEVCTSWVEFISDVHTFFLTNKRRMSLIFWKIWTSSTIMFHKYLIHVVKKAIRNLSISEKIYLIVDGQTFSTNRCRQNWFTENFYCKGKFICVLDMSCKNIVWQTHVFFAYVHNGIKIFTQSLGVFSY